MPETSVDRSPAAATTSASALAAHLNCSRIYIGKLEADGVIQLVAGYDVANNPGTRL
jgi:hypothetical protein